MIGHHTIGNDFNTRKIRYPPNLCPQPLLRHRVKKHLFVHRPRHTVVHCHTPSNPQSSPSHSFHDAETRANMQVISTCPLIILMKSVARYLTLSPQRLGLYWAKYQAMGNASGSRCPIAKRSSRVVIKRFLVKLSATSRTSSTSPQPRVLDQSSTSPRPVLDQSSTQSSHKS